jgi:hypothetical protein
MRRQLRSGDEPVRRRLLVGAVILSLEREELVNCAHGIAIPRRDAHLAAAR